jgi:eukaryotic-like serine/threonine-protein kinase
VADEVVADRYELEELIGSGGMSSVYRARDRLLERHVALKILHDHHAADEDFVERFRREARAVAQLSHPNIVTVIDRGQDSGRQFIVFEHVDGQNLKEVVVAAGPLPVRRALELGLQIARGLAFAHAQGLVHRDVKPQNVLLNGNGQAKVTDFGIARSIDVEVGVTQTGTILGTSNYLAPEQANGESVTPQTDVYSLGVVLYELLTGDVPFTGESFVAVAMKHINEAPPDLREQRADVPPRLAAAVERALAKEPKDRFASMDDFCTELAACLSELDPEVDPEATMIQPRTIQQAPPSRVARRRRSRAPLAVAVLVPVLALAAAAAYLLHTSGIGNLPSPVAPRSASKPVRLLGVGAFDPPPGDGAEHDAAAPRAVDGVSTTRWQTEHYRGDTLGKPGVGLVLDAGRTVHVSRITVISDTPGFRAEIRAGDSATGGFKTVSGANTVGGSTTFVLQDASARYFVVWITGLPAGGDSVDVNEVHAST